MRPSRHSTYHEVVEALDQGGCPICTLAARSVRRQLEALSYELVNDPELRAALRAAHGFCRRHAWQLVDLGGTVLATAIIYADVLRAVQQRLSKQAPTRPGNSAPGLLATLLGASPARRRSAPAACPACDTEAEAQSRFLGIVVEQAADPSFRTRYEAADGLCLPHLASSLERAEGDAAIFLASATSRKLHPLLQELGEFIRKQDYRFTHEGLTEQEATAPARAVRLAAGEPPNGVREGLTKRRSDGRRRVQSPTRGAHDDD